MSWVIFQLLFKRIIRLGISVTRESETPFWFWKFSNHFVNVKTCTFLLLANLTQETTVSLYLVFMEGRWSFHLSNCSPLLVFFSPGYQDPDWHLINHSSWHIFDVLCCSSSRHVTLQKVFHYSFTQFPDTLEACMEQHITESLSVCSACNALRWAWSAFLHWVRSASFTSLTNLHFVMPQSEQVHFNINLPFVAELMKQWIRSKNSPQHWDTFERTVLPNKTIISCLALAFSPAR